MKGHGGGGHKTVWIISYTPVAKEPRVIRQAKALEEAGWGLCVFGLPGLEPCPPSWSFVGLLEKSLPRSIKAALLARGALLLRVPGAAIARFGILPSIRFMGARLNHCATFYITGSVKPS